MSQEIEMRTYVTYLYPGSFLPEEGKSVQVPGPEVASVLGESPDERWFAAEVSTSEWERFTSATGEERWLRTTKPSVKFRLYVGEVFTAADVEALDGDHRGLLVNMSVNGWDQMVRTRAGNWQPLDATDVILPWTADQVVDGSSRRKP